MTTPTAGSLPYPQAPINNLGRISPANSTSSLPYQSPSVPLSQLPSQPHAGPSTTPRAAQQPLHSAAAPVIPVQPPAPPSSQPVAGPSRSPLYQQPQQYPASNDVSSGPHSANQQFNANDPQIQARLALAAQQAAGGPGGLPIADGQERRPPGVPPDFAAMAGVMSGMQGSTPDALMKQFQALQSSQAARARSGLSQSQTAGQSNNGGNPTMPGPSGPSASSSTANAVDPTVVTPASASTPPNQPSITYNDLDLAQQNMQNFALPVQGAPESLQSQMNHESGSGESQPQAFTNGSGLGPGAAGTPMSDQQRTFLLAQQERMRSAQQIQVQRQQQQPQPQQSARPPPPPAHQLSLSQPPVPPNPAGAPIPARPPIPSGLGRPTNANQQRQQFIASLASFHKTAGLPVPSAIFNGERDGSFKVGDAWMDVIDLFMAVVKNGGIMNVMQQDADSPLWRGLLQGRGIPNPLPEPLPMPKIAGSDPAAPAQYTTDPVQYLVAAYFAWLQAFEHHMTKHRQVAFQRQQAQAVAGRPPSLPNGMAFPPSANGVPQSISAPSPINMSAPTSVLGTSSATPYSPSVPSPSDVVQQLVNKGKQYKGKGKKGDKGAPAPIKTSSAGASPATTGLPETPASGKKRKREKKGDKGTGSANTSTPSTPLPTQHALAQPSAPVERPSTPKRARYRVEYRPIHKPLATLGGWDRDTVAATFPKNAMLQGTKSIHDLGIVDMEAVLMGLRSRVPSELGYAMTVLSMLSMPHPEEHIGGLPLHHLQEIFLEIIDLVGEAAYGEDGWAQWQNRLIEPMPKISPPTTDGLRESAKQGGTDLNKLTFLELEQLGRDSDFSLEDVSVVGPNLPRDRTGAQTDIVLAGMNLLRNFSMLTDNQEIMAARPDLLNLLAAVTDAKLCRLPFEVDEIRVKPYSILELARVRRDAVKILTNIGTFIRLTSTPIRSTRAIFQLLSTFLTSAWESLLLKEPIYGSSASISIREIPSSPILSINRALEAFCKIASSDSNREVLGSIPSDQLVSLFDGLIKLFPVDQRQFEAMHSVEECLAFYECLALALYSVVFLAPVSTRATMRSVPGALNVISRVILDTALQKPEFKVNPFAILCRRLCETLGVLNGTVTASGAAVGGMSFSSGGIDGSGWKFASKKVERGWLANRNEEILGVVMGVKGIDLPAFEEIEGMCWGGGD